MLTTDLGRERGEKRFSLLCLKWILFLGVLPFEKAALTLYASRAVGEAISFALNALTLILAMGSLVKIRFKRQKRTAEKYILFYIVLIVTYAMAIFVEEIRLTRFLSLLCLLGYCLLVICTYEDIDDAIRDINRALLLIIALSFGLYIAGSEQVLYIENASKTVFKGIVANRNTYSEISLFYIATSFYLWRWDVKRLLWQIPMLLVAVLTTVLTNGATSILCLCLLLLVMLALQIKGASRFLSFNLFLTLYLALFVLLLGSRGADFPLLRYVSALFGKSSTLTGRLEIWSAALGELYKSPIFGFGYDTSLLLDLGIRENDPHSGLLYIALTQGLLGVVAFACMLVFLIKNSGRADLRNDRRYQTMLVFILVWLVKGLVESVFSYTHFVFWCALIAAELRARRITERRYG